MSTKSHKLNKESDKDLAFEQQVTRLYQQSKRHTIAPNVDIAALTEQQQAEKLASTNKRQATAKAQSTATLGKALLLLFGGGCASFAIMAIISHLARQSPPTLPQPGAAKTAITPLLPITPAAELTLTTPKEKAKIPAKPNLVPRPNSSTLEQAAAEQVAPLEYDIDANFAMRIHMPNFTLNQQPQLIHRVMPKYPSNALRHLVQGQVTFSYQVNPLGEVNTIDLVSSNVNRELQRSAKKALAQWQYQKAQTKYHQ